MTALLGAVLVIGVNALLGNVPRGEPLAVLAHVNERPWLLMRLAGVLAMVAWLVAFTTISTTLTHPRGHALARMANPALTVAVAVFAVDYAHDGFSIGALAHQWNDGVLGDADALVQARAIGTLIGGTSILSQALLGLALAGHAAAMLIAREYPRVLSWIGVIGGTAWFLGGAAHFAQVPGSSFELILPGAGVTTIWTICLAVTLLRHSVRNPAG